MSDKPTIDSMGVAPKAQLETALLDARAVATLVAGSGRHRDVASIPDVTRLKGILIMYDARSIAIPP